MPEPTILHRCPTCERVFDSPSVCMEDNAETVPFPAVVPTQHFDPDVLAKSRELKP